MESTQASQQARESALATFIDRLIAELEPLSIQHNQSVWLANATGAPEHEQESARLDARIRTLYARPDAYAFLRDTAAAGVSDPTLARQLALLLDQHRANQIAPERIERMVAIEKRLESTFNHHRAELDGERVSDNAIRQHLQTSDDAALRRRAWEASKQVGAAVVEDLLGLVRLRNQAARELGFDNYYAMMLALDELDERELFTLLDDVDAGTRPLFEDYRRTLDARLCERFHVTPAELRPWHFSDPFFQQAPAADLDLDHWFEAQSLETLTERTFAGVGLDVRDLLARADLYERPGKCQHAFCQSIDRRDDIRVLCNVRPDERWMATMLHEFGHAVYDQGIDRTLPFVLRVPAHTLTTEAVAMLFGRLSKNATWLERYAGVPAAEARAAGEACAREMRAQLLVQTRWELVMCHMERALYQDPEQDLATRWWDLVERYQWVPRPEGRRAPDWASKIHFSIAPVYYQNYLLGEIMASQLQAHLLREIGGEGPERWSRVLTRPETGAFLRTRLFASGRAMDWRRTLAHAVGAPLSPAGFVDELAGRA